VSPGSRALKNAKYEKFCRLRASAQPRVAAYRGAGWEESDDDDAYSNACRLERRPGVRDQFIRDTEQWNQGAVVTDKPGRPDHCGRAGAGAQAAHRSFFDIGHILLQSATSYLLDRGECQSPWPIEGMDTRRLQHLLGHASITNRVRSTAMSPEPFKDIWR
jgi:hypothetical protein